MLVLPPLLVLLLLADIDACASFPCAAGLVPADCADTTGGVNGTAGRTCTCTGGAGYFYNITGGEDFGCQGGLGIGWSVGTSTSQECRLLLEPCANAQHMMLVFAVMHNPG